MSIDRKQFPIIPAAGITIHKSQGATFDGVAIHPKPGISTSALYVACGRSTSASGLYIVGKFNPPRAPAENDQVRAELCRLRTEKKLITHYEENFNSESIEIFYHNVQSLHKHIEDVRMDHLVRSLDIFTPIANNK